MQEKALVVHLELHKKVVKNAWILSYEGRKVLVIEFQETVTEDESIAYIFALAKSLVSGKGSETLSPELMKMVKGTYVRILDELREKAEEARLATNRSKKFTSKLMDCYEFDTEKYTKALKEIDNKEGLTDKQCSKLIREAMVKHLKIVVDPEMLKELIQEYIDEEISDEHLDIARATLKELKQIQVVLKEK